MSSINFMAPKQPKIPRTRRSDTVSTDGLQELQGISRQDAVVNAALSDLHMHDGPVDIQLKVAPTHNFRKVTMYEDELDSSAEEGQASEKNDDRLALPATLYSNYEVLLTFISILSYIFDVGSDVYVAVLYYRDGDTWWFTLTVIFIIVPSLTITLFSFVWYIQDGGSCRSYPLIWLPRLILLFLQLGPLLRYIDTMIFGYRSKSMQWKHRRSYWYRLKTYEETDSALLRLLECFLEAAPQLTLQLYIILCHGVKQNLMLGIGQIVSCVTSLGSISWALAAYQKALRLSLPSKAKLDGWSMVFLFVWRILVIGPRVFSFAMFAVWSQYGLFVLCGIHWMIMLVWILMQRTTFCNTKIQEYCFNIVAAFMCIFDFLNLVEGHTRIRYVVYYSIVYCENVAMVTLWYYNLSSTSEFYLLPIIISVFVVFWIGILMQVVYYLVFHPNNKPPFAGEKRIRLCVPLSELVGCKRSDSSKGSVAV